MLPRPIEDFIKIRDVPKVFKKLTGTWFTKKTIYCWINIGRLSYDGRRIKLLTQKRFGLRFTTYDWIRKFIAEIG